jgi:hypothetical protein
VRKNPAGQIELAWPADGPSFALQAATNLSPPVTWFSVTNTPVLTNNQYVVTFSPALGNRFYRLVLP